MAILFPINSIWRAFAPRFPSADLSSISTPIEDAFGLRARAVQNVLSVLKVKSAEGRCSCFLYPNAALAPTIFNCF